MTYSTYSIEDLLLELEDTETIIKKLSEDYMWFQYAEASYRDPKEAERRRQCQFNLETQRAKKEKILQELDNRKEKEIELKEKIGRKL